MPLAATDHTHSSETNSGEKYTTRDCSNITITPLALPKTVRSGGSSCAPFFPAQNPSEVSSKHHQDAGPGPCALDGS